MLDDLNLKKERVLHPGLDTGQTERPPEKPEAPRRRTGRWVACLVGLFLLGTIGGLVVLSRGLWVSQQITRWAASHFHRHFPATLSIEQAILHPLENAFELRGVRIVPDPPALRHGPGPTTEGTAAVPIRLDRLRVIYDPLSLLKGERRIRELQLIRPQIQLVIGKDGRINLQELATAVRARLSQKGKPRIAIDRIHLSQGEASLQDERHRFSSELFDIQFRGMAAAPGKDLVGRLQAKGRLSYPGRSHALDSLWADLSFGQEALTLKRLAIESQGMGLNLQGKAVRLGSPQSTLSATFLLKAPQPALERIAFARNLKLKGDFQAQGQLEGPLTALRASLEMTSPQGSMQELGFRRLRGVAQVTLQGVRLTHLSAELLGGRLQGKGWLPFSFENQHRPSRNGRSQGVSHAKRPENPPGRAAQAPTRRRPGDPAPIPGKERWMPEETAR